jgi:toxin-antitoxin system PIN domain toxin
MRALLDVNVLLALLDAHHLDHGRARTWLQGALSEGWASCAITQNGFVRIISQPRYPNPEPPAQAIDRLAQATADAHHEFWTCSVSVTAEGAVDRSRLHGAAQVTDAYLLALAVAEGGRLVTLDRSIPLSAVHGATPDHLVTL